MSTSLLTQNFNKGKKPKSFYDKEHKKGDRVQVTLASVKRKYGPNAVAKAKALVNQLADDDTKRLLLSDMGNSPAVVKKVLELGDQAEVARKDVIEEIGDMVMYDRSPSMVRERVKSVENEIKDNFNKTISVEEKQEHINTFGPLEMT